MRAISCNNWILNNDYFNAIDWYIDILGEDNYLYENN